MSKFSDVYLIINFKTNEKLILKKIKSNCKLLPDDHEE